MFYFMQASPYGLVPWALKISAMHQLTWAPPTFPTAARILRGTAAFLLKCLKQVLEAGIYQSTTSNIYDSAMQWHCGGPVASTAWPRVWRFLPVHFVLDACWTRAGRVLAWGKWGV